MTKKRSWPSHLSLPFAAALVYFLDVPDVPEKIHGAGV
jgi:hypothetical protein